MQRLVISFLVFCVAFQAIPEAVFAQTLGERLAGRMLLAVEDRGRGWYVAPAGVRYDVTQKGELAKLALGITNADLGRIDVRRRVAGRILLAVERAGELWYVDPITLRATSLTDATSVVRTYGLGITNVNLAAIRMANPADETTSSDEGSDESVLLDVPFTTQAPLGEWSDARQGEGCEEASVLMALKWAKRESLTTASARQSIIAMSDWEKETYGTYYDTSVPDTANRLFKEYFDFHDIEVRTGITTDDIRAELQKGHVVLTTVNGQKLGNPNFVSGGPLRHMIVVVGYDATTDEFITHDPGTHAGRNYRYSTKVLQDALRDYPSGNHAPITDMPDAMIVVTK